MLVRLTKDYEFEASLSYIEGHYLKITNQIKLVHTVITRFSDVEMKIKVMLYRAEDVSQLVE